MYFGEWVLIAVRSDLLPISVRYKGERGLELASQAPCVHTCASNVIHAGFIVGLVHCGSVF